MLNKEKLSIDELKDKINKLKDINNKIKQDKEMIKKKHELGLITWDIKSDILRLDRNIKENEKQIEKYSKALYRLKKKEQ